MSVFKIGPEFVSGSDRLSAAAVALRRGRCGEAWSDFNVQEALVNSGYGRFASLATKLAEGTGTQATAGTGAYIADTIAGGYSVLEVDSNSTTNGQGYQIQWKGHGWYPEEGGCFYMYLRARFKDIATAPEFFAGLATIDTTLIASDLMSATNWVGFLSLSGGTIVAGVDDGTEDLSGTLHTMVDGDTTTDGTEIVDLDLKWRVGDTIEAYVNGVKQDLSGIDLANEPDAGFIVPSVVLQTNGTTDPILHVLEFDVGYKYPA
jgi:hypothetical protein